MGPEMGHIDRAIKRARAKRERELARLGKRARKYTGALMSDWLDAQAVLRDAGDGDDIKLWLAITSGFREMLGQAEDLSKVFTTAGDAGGKAT